MKGASQYADLSVTGNAAHVLASGSDFLNAAGAAVKSLDRQIGVRTDRLNEMKSSGGTSKDVMNHEANQIDLLSKLRDRLELSMKRIANIISGKDMDDDTAAAASATQRRRKEQDLVGATRSAANAQASAVGGAGAVNVVQPLAAPVTSASTSGGSSNTGSGAGDSTMRLALRAYGKVSQ